MTIENKVILTERTDIAKALNFGKYPVLTFDVDNDKGSLAVVTKESGRFGNMRSKCTLYRGKQTRDDGIFYLLTHATMLKSHYNVDDYLENAEFANAPVINEGEEVAILVYSKLNNTCFVQIVKAGKVDPSYATAVTFE